MRLPTVFSLSCLLFLLAGCGGHDPSTTPVPRTGDAAVGDPSQPLAAPGLTGCTLEGTLSEAAVATAVARAGTTETPLTDEDLDAQGFRFSFELDSGTTALTITATDQAENTRTMATTIRTGDE